MALGEPHQPALVADQPLVDVVELLHQGIDARPIEPQRFHLGDDLLLELLVAALLRRRERIVAQLVLNVLVLQAAQPLVAVGDLVEGLQHLRLELGLDGGERQRILYVVVVELGFAGRRRLAVGGLALLVIGAFGRSSLERRGAGGRGRRRRRGGEHGRGRVSGRGDNRLSVGADRRRRDRLGVGPGISRFEIDDVAQENLALVQLVAPDDDGLERERAFAQPRDHRLAAGLDAFGNRDFARTRKQLDRSDRPQIHAHGIVGALSRLLGLGLGWNRFPDLDQRATLRFLLLLLGFLALFLALFAGLLGLDDVDAHLAERRKEILDLLGIYLFRQRSDLVVGNVAALLGTADQRLDIVRQVEHWAVLRRL